MLDFIVMQMRKANREKGYCADNLVTCNFFKSSGLKVKVYIFLAYPLGELIELIVSFFFNVASS